MDNSRHDITDGNPQNDFISVEQLIGGPTWVDGDQVCVVDGTNNGEGEVGSNENQLPRCGKDYAAICGELEWMMPVKWRM